MSEDVDFVTTLGRPLIAHRLRRLSEMFVEAYAGWLSEVGIDLPPRGLSTVMLLDRDGPLGVTEIAAQLRLSHPLVIKLVAMLEAGGYVATIADPGDGRRRPVGLTASGRAAAQRLGIALGGMDRAYADLFAEAGADLFDAVRRIEDACRDTSFQQRLRRAVTTIANDEDMICA